MSAGISSDLHHLMGKENHLIFPNDFPYEYATTYSTESRTEMAGLTHRFSRSVSLQEPPFNFKEKKIFSGLPESTLCRSASGYSPAPLPPLDVKKDEEAWNLIYAAAEEIARMRIRMSVIGVPHGFEHPRRSQWQRYLCRNGGGSAWYPPQVQNQRKHVVDGPGGGCDSGYTPATRECVGTGVFLPRRYYCSSNTPAGIIKSSPKSFYPITGPLQLQAHINDGFVSRCGNSSSVFRSELSLIK
ncbi:hypothetical protein E3N88_38525 [Mikania micrantha]|uniref:Uncharacterized protein n=1 Tax=Mikania micrantha TaxID=192012 RepID=A0A5N6LU84_9ASTR|nr:hypothetical protein E3N88_38525 [Mikania micrantha]